MILGLILYSASGISNYLMAIMGTDQVLRDVWAGNLPTPLHDTIGLIFVTDAFSRATGMMLLGMGLYKTGYLKDPSLALKHQPLALGAILVGGFASALGLLWSHQHDYSATSILIGNIANTVGTIPMSLGYLVFLITWDHKGTSLILDPLRRLGQSALTNYLGQTVVCLILVSILPRELLSRSLLLVTVLVIWLLQVKASSIWLSQFRFGPIEWLWRSATYRRLEPLRRAPHKQKPSTSLVGPSFKDDAYLANLFSVITNDHEIRCTIRRAHELGNTGKEAFFTIIVELHDVPSLV